MTKLYWKDPESIEGNDYIITTVEGKECNSFKDIYDMFRGMHDELEDDSVLLINYNSGGSEAEVTPDEIIEVEVEYAIYLQVEQQITFPDGDEECIDLDGLLEKRGSYDTFDEVKRDLNYLTGL